MAITFVAAGAFAARSNTQLTATPALPAGTAQDDILIMSLLSRKTASAVTWTITDWTSIIKSFNTNDYTQELFWKRALTGEAAPTVTIDDAGGGWSATIAGFRGVKLSGSPIEGTPIHTEGSSTTLTSGAVTTVTNGAFIINFYASAVTAAGAIGTYSAPQVETFGGAAYVTTLSNDHSVAMAHFEKATAGAGGTHTATTSPTTVFGVSSFALTPQGAGGASDFLPLLRGFDPHYLRI